MLGSCNHRVAASSSISVAGPSWAPILSSSCKRRIYKLVQPSLSSSLSLSATEDLFGAALLISPNLRGSNRPSLLVTASLVESPVLWAIRTCVFYALLQVGIAGRPIFGGDVGESQSPPKWLQSLIGSPEGKENKRVKNKWQTTTKGTLKRRYRVPTKAEGRRLLNMIMGLLSDDDTFRDATSHKGCQIRRENAHAETVCCHNVRAMFDELPTPHLVIEITAFPAGPITAADYEKAEKIEKLLKSGRSI